MRPIDDYDNTSNDDHGRRDQRGFGPRGPRFGGARQHHGGFPGRDRGDHGGRGGFGPGFGGRGGFGPGMGFGPGFGGPGFGRERRRRGDVRLAILGLLAEGPQNGYAIIKTIAERTGGAWKPSPGSVYPTLQQLVDEDLVVSTGDGRKTLFELTDAGKAEAESKADEIAAAWESTPGVPDAQREFIESLRKTMGVLHMYRTSATEEQTKAAAAKVDQLRKDLLQILAD
ncbi:MULTISPECIES: PadR family transcriptional regulator [unclassified Curtobacterium]|uniref:PadR family transcriptional regulator n=1 Tax=unclassified Curtobacterium TaxID=257496 RepID=UPI000F4CF91E|nr:MULTISPECIES: PadR family transcriptional regulator [unclassified Curtobacterium]ROP63326.1 PadR family transcriptional regulator [Curtobacterium sp. ZW137]TCK66202.1 PadR family transcriptional regulator [Curtobacterium sp. PhB136]